MRSIGRVDLDCGKPLMRRFYQTRQRILYWPGGGVVTPFKSWSVNGVYSVEQEASLRKPEARKQLIVTRSPETTTNGATIVTRPLGVASNS